MKKLIVIGFVMSAALGACGGKKAATTMPDNKGGSDMKSGATGGQGYGDAATAAPAPAPAGGAAASDPCSGGQ